MDASPIGPSLTTFSATRIHSVGMPLDDPVTDHRLGTLEADYATTVAAPWQPCPVRVNPPGISCVYEEGNTERDPLRVAGHERGAFVTATDSRKARQRRANLRTVAAGSAIVLLTPFATGGMTRMVILFVLSIATGGLLWKIPPFEIPHHDKFWDLTKERFWELTLFAAKVAAALTLIAVIISPFYALLARHSFTETVLTYAAIGAATGTALGCLGWIAFRVVDDVEILRTEIEKTDAAMKPPKES